eukprot:gene4090-5118_t
MISSTIGNSISKEEEIEIKNSTKYSDEEYLVRVKLAAAYRLVSYHGWDQIIGNHLTARVPGTEYILINPYGLRFDEITASSLVKLDLDGNIIDPGTTRYGVNSTGYVIHSAIHRGRPDIISTMHTHPVAGVAVSCLKDGLSRFHQNDFIVPDISYHEYEGISLDLGEQERIISSLGPKNMVLIMRNHGLVSCGRSIEEAYYTLFILTKACEIQVAMLSSVGGDISKLVAVDQSTQTKSQLLASKFNKEGFGTREFRAMFRKMDSLDPSFRN